MIGGFNPHKHHGIKNVLAPDLEVDLTAVAFLLPLTAPLCCFILELCSLSPGGETKKRRERKATKKNVSLRQKCNNQA